MTKQFTIGALLAILAMPGMAADRTAMSGFYATANAGGGQIYSPYEFLNGSTGSYAYSAVVWGLNFGYMHALNQHFAVGIELGYYDNGQTKYNGSGGSSDTGSLQIHSNNWDILGAANYLWSNGLNVFAKAGLAYVEQTAELEAPVTFPNATISNSFTNRNYAYRPMAEWGIGYQLNSRWNVYGMGSYIFADHGNNWKSVNGQSTVNNTLFSVMTWQLGINYTFAS